MKTNTIIKAILSNQESTTKTLANLVVRDSVYATNIAWNPLSESIEIWEAGPENKDWTATLSLPSDSCEKRELLASVQFETPEDIDESEEDWDDANRLEWAESVINDILNEQLFEWSKQYWAYFGITDPSDFEELLVRIDNLVDTETCKDRIAELNDFKFKLENPELQDEFHNDEVDDCEFTEEDAKAEVEETDVENQAREVYASFVNGNFTTAREELADANDIIEEVAEFIVTQKSEFTEEFRDWLMQELASVVKQGHWKVN